jgi:hypothetical protein
MPTNLRSAYSASRDLLLLQDEWPSTLFYTEIVYAGADLCAVDMSHWPSAPLELDKRHAFRCTPAEKDRDIIKRMISPVLLAVNLSALSQASKECRAGEDVEFWPLASCCFASSSQDAAPSQSVSRRGTHLFAQPAKIIHYD